MTRAIALLLCLCSALASAGPQPFVPDSLTRIMTNHQGQAFALVLWSVDCPPCLAELSELSALRDQIDQGRLVLVSTDTGEMLEQVELTLQELGLDQVEHLAFGDSLPELLRFRIDPSWAGELPRAYLYDAQHQRQAISGRLSRQQILQALGK